MQHAEHRTSPPFVSAPEARPRYVPPTPATAPRPGGKSVGSHQFVHPFFHPEIHPEIIRNHSKPSEIIRNHQKSWEEGFQLFKKKPQNTKTPGPSPRQDRHHHGRTTSQILRPWSAPKKRTLLRWWFSVSFPFGGICFLVPWRVFTSDVDFKKIHHQRVRNTFHRRLHWTFKSLLESRNHLCQWSDQKVLNEVVFHKCLEKCRWLCSK